MADSRDPFVNGMRLLSCCQALRGRFLVPELACAVPPFLNPHTGFSMSNHLLPALSGTRASTSRFSVCLAAFAAAPIAGAGIVNGGF